MNRWEERMKMGFLLSSIFWGIVLICFGILLVLKHLFDWDIPVGKIIFAVMLILTGIFLFTGKGHLVNGTWKHHSGDRETSVVFGNITFDKTDIKSEYNVVFGRGVLDLTEVPESSIPRNIDINIIFADGEILVPGKLPVVIKSDTAFGQTDFPDGSVPGFGEKSYRSQAATETENPIIINVDCVFGKCVFTEIR